MGNTVDAGGICFAGVSQWDVEWLDPMDDLPFFIRKDRDRELAARERGPKVLASLKDRGHAMCNIPIPVKTQMSPNGGAGDWSAEAQADRRFGVEGVIVARSDAHGLCYAVQHRDDGSIGWYNPDELQLIA